MYYPLVETRHISCSSTRTLQLQREQAGEDVQAWNFSTEAFAGTIPLPSGSDSGTPERLLCWQLQNSGDCSLQLAEVSLGGGPIGAAVQLTIPGHAFPSLAHAVVGDKLCLYLLMSDHAVAALQLPLGGAGGGARQQQRLAPMLDSLQPHRLYCVQLGAQLAPVGAPTAVAVSGGQLCVAGSSAVVAAVPLDARGGLAPAQTTTLSTSNSLLQRLVGNLYAAGPHRLGCAGALPVRVGGRQVLLLVHDDCSVRGWDVGGQQQLLVDCIHPDRGAAANLAPHGVVLASDGSDGAPAVIVAELEAADGGGGGGSVFVAASISLGPNERPAVQDKLLLQLPAGKARLLGAALGGSGGGGLWVLASVEGRAAVLAFDLTDGRFEVRFEVPRWPAVLACARPVLTLPL